MVPELFAAIVQLPVFNNVKAPVDESTLQTSVVVDEKTMLPIDEGEVVAVTEPLPP